MDEKRKETRGRPPKLTTDPDLIIKAVLHFLQVFMTETIAKRIVCLILIATGTPYTRIIELVGISKRSIWAIKSAVHRGDVDSLFSLKGRTGRPGKAKDVESAIVEELEKDNYHTRQQVADMILEKFGISMSISAVGRLLKKMA